ncbi:uncharacterized protein V6R79_006742 [Siganus canaliculatus]
MLLPCFAPLQTDAFLLRDNARLTWSSFVVLLLSDSSSRHWNQEAENRNSLNPASHFLVSEGSFRLKSHEKNSDGTLQ